MTHAHRRKVAGLLALLAVGSVLAACQSSGSTANQSSGKPAAGSSSSSSSHPGSSSSHNGTVRVLYAGSLVNVLEHHMGPAFHKASGYSYQGYGGGSSKVANEIKGKVRRGDVFISANPSVNKSLMGKAGYVSWYSTFARSPLVLGYNPKSKFAKQLKTKPWYKVVTQPGFKLGRTDPKLDPKGKLTAKAINKTAEERHKPVLKNKILANAKVFPEEDLAGRLQSGHLDAGFFYSIETSDLDTPTVSLRPVRLSARYTVTVLKHAPNAKGGAAFAAFLFGDRGSKILRQNGFELVHPARVAGDKSAVPDKLRSAMQAG
jgi:molybdate/tungstate transport system substrate-binding protein